MKYFQDEVVNSTNRVLFKQFNRRINKSQGAILDDLILSKYKTSLEDDSDNIQLLLPDGTANPYYIETDGKSLIILILIYPI